MQKNTKTPIILNVDTGIDDAVATAMASFSKKLDIKLIACGAGNVTPERSAKNTLNILKMLQRTDIPVALGCKKPLKRENSTLYAHGESGMGEYPFPPNDLKPISENAIEKMREIIEANENTIVVCLSPLTNVAVLLQKYPHLSTKFKVLLSAGTIDDFDSEGVPYPSFNVAVDPEAFDFVEASGVPIEICPSDMGHIAYLSWEEVFKTKTTNITGEIFEYIFRSYHDRHIKNGIATHDACAIAYLIKPELFEVANMQVKIEYYDKIKTGVLLFNKKIGEIHPVLTNINTKEFKKLFFSLLKKMP